MPVGAAADSSSLAAGFVCWFYPCGKSASRVKPNCGKQTLGVSHDAPPHLSHKSYKSYKSYASVTPPQPAHRRCHQVARHTPAANLRPSHTKLRQANPRGIQGRTNLSDRSDWSDRSDTSATPPQPAHRRCHQKSPAYPNGESAPSHSTRRLANPRGITWLATAQPIRAKTGAPIIIL